MSLFDPISGELAVRHTAGRLGWKTPRSPHAAVAMCAAAIAVVIETWHYLGDLPFDLYVGGVPVSPSIVPVVVILAVSGPRLRGRARSSDSAKTFWTLTIMVLAVTTIAVDGMAPDRSAGFILAALSEELVYRVAGPALLAFGLARAGIRYQHALTFGYLIAGATFVVLPGHVEQWDVAAYIFPFIAFTVLATLAVHRSGAILEIGVLHSVVNMVNLGRATGAIDTSGAVMVAALLALLVIAYIPAGGRHPDLLIDLTGDEPSLSSGGQHWTLADADEARDADHTDGSAAPTHRAPASDAPPTA